MSEVTACGQLAHRSSLSRPSDERGDGARHFPPEGTLRFHHEDIGVGDDDDQHADGHGDVGELAEFFDGVQEDRPVNARTDAEQRESVPGLLQDAFSHEDKADQHAVSQEHCTLV